MPEIFTTSLGPMVEDEHPLPWLRRLDLKLDHPHMRQAILADGMTLQVKIDCLFDEQGALGLGHAFGVAHPDRSHPALQAGSFVSHVFWNQLDTYGLDVSIRKPLQVPLTAVEAVGKRKVGEIRTSVFRFCQLLHDTHHIRSVALTAHLKQRPAAGAKSAAYALQDREMIDDPMERGTREYYVEFAIEWKASGIEDFESQIRPRGVWIPGLGKRDHVFGAVDSEDRPLRQHGGDLSGDLPIATAMSRIRSSPFKPNLEMSSRAHCCCADELCA